MNSKVRISAIILAKNEADRIETCIKSLSWADEIIVIDNASTDETKAIALKHKAKVFTEKSEDFAALRNSGVAKATGEWLLYVDADEVVTKELADEIQRRITNGELRLPAQAGMANVNGLLIRRKNYYLGNPWPGEEHMLRLIKKDALVGWHGALHETAEVKGDIGQLDGLLVHHTHRTLSEMVAKTNRWSETEARLRFDAHHPPVVWWRFLRVMLTAFYDSYIKQRGWRAGAVGFIESMYQSFSIFITYAKLWEMQHNTK